MESETRKWGDRQSLLRVHGEVFVLQAFGDALMKVGSRKRGRRSPGAECEIGRLTFSPLAVFALGDAANGKIFVEVRPVKSKG